jgi:hypothetical protein
MSPSLAIRLVSADYQLFGSNYQVEVSDGSPPTGMKRKTANIDIRVEPQLVEKIDVWRARQRVSPSRAAAIVYMLDHFLEHDLPELTVA